MRCRVLSSRHPFFIAGMCVTFMLLTLYAHLHEPLNDEEKKRLHEQKIDSGEVQISPGRDNMDEDELPLGADTEKVDGFFDSVNTTRTFEEGCWKCGGPSTKSIPMGSLEVPTLLRLVAKTECSSSGSGGTSAGRDPSKLSDNPECVTSGSKHSGTNPSKRIQTAVLVYGPIVASSTSLDGEGRTDVPTQESLLKQRSRFLQRMLISLKGHVLDTVQPAAVHLHSFGEERKKGEGSPKERVMQFQIASAWKVFRGSKCSMESCWHSIELASLTSFLGALKQVHPDLHLHQNMSSVVLSEFLRDPFFDTVARELDTVVLHPIAMSFLRHASLFRLDNDPSAPDVDYIFLMKTTSFLWSGLSFTSIDSGGSLSSPDYRYLEVTCVDSEALCRGKERRATQELQKLNVAELNVDVSKWEVKGAKEHSLSYLEGPYAGDRIPPAGATVVTKGQPKRIFRGPLLDPMYTVTAAGDPIILWPTSLLFNMHGSSLTDRYTLGDDVMLAGKEAAAQWLQEEFPFLIKYASYLFARHAKDHGRLDRLRTASSSRLLGFAMHRMATKRSDCARAFQVDLAGEGSRTTQLESSEKRRNTCPVVAFTDFKVSRLSVSTDRSNVFTTRLLFGHQTIFSRPVNPPLQQRELQCYWYKTVRANTAPRHKPSPHSSDVLAELQFAKVDKGSGPACQIPLMRIILNGSSTTETLRRVELLRPSRVWPLCSTWIQSVGKAALFPNGKSSRKGFCFSDSNSLDLGTMVTEGRGRKSPPPMNVFFATFSRDDGDSRRGEDLKKRLDTVLHDKENLKQQQRGKEGLGVPMKGTVRCPLCELGPHVSESVVGQLEEELSQRSADFQDRL